MAEERISPAVVIIPLGLGLGLVAALGIAALAWAAPAATQQEVQAAHLAYLQEIAPGSAATLALEEAIGYPGTEVSFGDPLIPDGCTIGTGPEYLGIPIGTFDPETGETWTSTGWR